MQYGAFFQRPGERAGERHLEAVEDPGDAERDDDQGMKAPPRQAIEACRQVGLDDGAGGVIAVRGCSHARAASWWRNTAAVSASKATSRISIPAAAPSALQTSTASRQASSKG